MRMSEKCRNNNNSDNPLTSRRTDGGKNFTLLQDSNNVFRCTIFDTLKDFSGETRKKNPCYQPD